MFSICNICILCLKSPTKSKYVTGAVSVVMIVSIMYDMKVSFITLDKL